MPNLTVEPLGLTIEVKDDQTMLDACLRNGIWLPHACSHGRCSTCKVEVLDGDVDHGDASTFALMDVEREAGQTLACCATLRGDVTIEAEIEEDEDAEHHPVEDHVGVIKEISVLAPEIKKVVLELPGAGLMFQAGQYINLHIPGLDKPRAFSIASAPHDKNVVELHVRQVPNGKGTTWIHEEAEEGMEMRFTGPLGRFFVRRSRSRPMVFVAGGSGLSSPWSMVVDELKKGQDMPMTLIHGARRPDGLYYREALEQLAAEHPDFEYIPVISEPEAVEGWTGETGMAHEALHRRFEGRFGGMSAYLCGPPPMIEACIKTLMKGRLFEQDIYTEKFVTNEEDAGAKSPLFKHI